MLIQSLIDDAKALTNCLNHLFIYYYYCVGYVICDSLQLCNNIADTKTEKEKLKNRKEQIGSFFA